MNHEPSAFTSLRRVGGYALACETEDPQADLAMTVGDILLTAIVALAMTVVDVYYPFGGHR